MTSIQASDWLMCQVCGVRGSHPGQVHQRAGHNLAPGVLPVPGVRHPGQIRRYPHVYYNDGSLQLGDDGFHERDNGAFCKDCYFGQFAPKCAGCNMPIKDNYISSLNQQVNIS